MNIAALSRKLHKWIFLFVGVQAFLWMTSGFYMVVLDRDLLSGGQMVRKTPAALKNPSDALPVNQVLDSYKAVESITLKSIGDEQFYLIRTKAGTYLVNSETGERVSPIDKHLAASIAEYYYEGQVSASTVEYISENAPVEVQGHKLPLWRVTFKDKFETSLYIDPNTAELALHRHAYWRAYDIFWMLHIMDYKNRVNYNNYLVRIVAFFSLVGVVSGFILIFHCFSRGKKTELKISR